MYFDNCPDKNAYITLEIKVEKIERKINQVTHSTMSDNNNGSYS